MSYLKSSLDSEKIIKTWFKPIPGVEKLDIFDLYVQDNTVSNLHYREESR